MISTFQRGLQQVELATLARDGQTFDLYVVNFERGCGNEVHGCTPAELYTERIEQDWTAYTRRRRPKNTPLDCRLCHQRGRDPTHALDARSRAALDAPSWSRCRHTNRIERERDAPGAMPPHEARQLHRDARD
jgi:hypothetical protein